MKYLNKRFSSPANSKEFVDNWEAIFGKSDAKPPAESKPVDLDPKFKPAPASKTGMKFEDLDADGVKDAGEPGLADWTIYVDYNDKGLKDAGEPFAVTGTDGTYTISGINPGIEYKVREVGKVGWTCSYPNVAADLLVKPVVSTACFYTETFTSGVTESGNDFGNWTTASKTGMKFEDLDADGVKDER